MIRICALHLGHSKGSISYMRLTCPAVVPAGTKADARGPTTSPKLLPIVALVLFRWSRGEQLLSALASTPTGVSSIVSSYRLIGFQEYAPRALQETLEHRASAFW
jgi:hypothetical protein